MLLYRAGHLSRKSMDSKKLRLSTETLVALNDKSSYQAAAKGPTKKCQTVPCPIASATLLELATHVTLDVRLVSHSSPHSSSVFTIRRDECTQDDLALIRQKTRHFARSPNILAPFLAAEAEVGRQSAAQVI